MSRLKSATLSSPQEAFNQVTDFIDETSRLTTYQLQILSFLKFISLTDPDFEGKLAEVTSMEQMLDQVTDENSDAVARQLRRLGRLPSCTVRVEHPETGASEILQGIGYSWETRSYQGMVGFDESGQPLLWPINHSSQLSIEIVPPAE